MKKLFVIILICSACSSTFKVNGVEIKQKVRPISHNEKPVYITAFLIGAGITSLFVTP